MYSKFTLLVRKRKLLTRKINQPSIELNALSEHALLVETCGGWCIGGTKDKSATPLLYARINLFIMVQQKQAIL